jgi:hypothetical protein
MRYLIREVVGWGLIGVGILLFYGAYSLAREKRLCEMLLLTVIGILVFRGGIHLIKVAVAARVSERAQDRLYPAPAPPPPPARSHPPGGIQGTRERPAR